MRMHSHSVDQNLQLSVSGFFWAHKLHVRMMKGLMRLYICENSFFSHGCFLNTGLSLYYKTNMHKEL